MCSRKPKVEQAAPAAAPAAAPVAAPLKIDNVAKDTKKENPNAKTKGKKKLTITQIGSGTGVNL